MSGLSESESFSQPFSQLALGREQAAAPPPIAPVPLSSKFSASEGESSHDLGGLKSWTPPAGGMEVDIKLSDGDGFNIPPPPPPPPPTSLPPAKPLKPTKSASSINIGLGLGQKSKKEEKSGGGGLFGGKNRTSKKEAMAIQGSQPFDESDINFEMRSEGENGSPKGKHARGASKDDMWIGESRLFSLFISIRLPDPELITLRSPRVSPSSILRHSSHLWISSNWSREELHLWNLSNFSNHQRVDLSSQEHPYASTNLLRSRSTSLSGSRSSSHPSPLRFSLSVLRERQLGSRERQLLHQLWSRHRRSFTHLFDRSNHQAFLLRRRRRYPTRFRSSANPSTLAAASKVDSRRSPFVAETSSEASCSRGRGCEGKERSEGFGDVGVLSGRRGYGFGCCSDA